MKTDPFWLAKKTLPNPFRKKGGRSGGSRERLPEGPGRFRVIAGRWLLVLSGISLVALGDALAKGNGDIGAFVAVSALIGVTIWVRR